VSGCFIPISSEGGHADFAARTPREVALQQVLTREYGRAEWEQVVSGPGLVNIHRFLHAHGCVAVPADLDPAKAPPLISEAALTRRCPECVETLAMFVSAYGAAAGNLALTSLPTAGLYLGGGIAPKILPALKTPAFLDAFCAKAPMEHLLRRIPVRVILNSLAGLIGAAAFLNARLQQ
jgi:glucokinase